MPIMKLTPLWQAMVGIALVTFIAYAPSLSNDFQAHDDTLLITRNAAAQGLSVTNIQTAFTTFDPELYIPLTLLSYQIEYSLFGLNPTVFHVTSLLLHIGSAILVLRITYRLVLDRSKHALWIATLTAGLFALHPLNTEAVAWAAARKDVLSSFFFFASLWAYLKIEDAKKWYGISIALFAIALLSKVSVIMLPVLLLLVDDFRGRRAGWPKRIAPFAALSVLFGAVALIGKQNQINALSLLEQLLLWCKSAATYVLHFVWPQGLTITYDQYAPVSIMRPEFFLSVLAVAAILGFAFFICRKRKFVSVALLWFLVCLLPSFATFWKNGFVFYASDRYAYIAIVGLCVLAATVLSRSKIFSGIVGVLLLVLCMQQSLTWKTTVTLYERAIALNEQPVLQLNNLGTYYFEQGDAETAMKLYNDAILYKEVPQTLINIGKLERQRGNLADSAEWFERSIEVLPENRPLTEEDIQGYFFLGEYYDLKNDPQKAIELFEEAAQRAPQFASSHENLAIMYHKYKRLPEAMASLQRAIAIDKKNLSTRYRLAAIASETGEFAIAIPQLEYIVKHDPNYEQAAVHLERLRQIMH